MLSFYSSGADFQYVVSTPRLLKTALKFRILCCDATYKLNEHNYPVIICGGIDANQKLHVLVYSVTTHERANNYQFVFESMKNKILELYSKDFKPEVLISDAASAIANGFKETFPDVDAKIVMCYFHVKQAISKKLGSNEYRDQIMEDVGKIHLAHSKEMFEHSVQLFDGKWRENLPDFCEYFKRYWVDSHSGWFAGFVHKCPSTNNHVEGYNSALKRCHTYREMMPLGDFNNEMFETWRSKSEKYMTHEIAQIVTIDKELWVQAIEWSTNIHDCITVSTSLTKSNCYIRSSTSTRDISFNEIKKYEEAIDLDRFDEFMDIMTSIWKVQFDSRSWESSICSCPRWSKI